MRCIKGVNFSMDTNILWPMVTGNCWKRLWTKTRSSNLVGIRLWRTQKTIVEL